MEKLRLQGNHEFPSIEFNPSLNQFEIIGRSIAQETEQHFNAAIDWIKNYIEQPNNETRVRLYLEYFNISSSKKLLEIVYLFNRLFHMHGGVSITWMYDQDEEDMLEVGHDFANLVEVPFDFEEVEAEYVQAVA